MRTSIFEMNTDIPPYEPPNNASQEDYEIVCPPPPNPSGEEPLTPDDVFPDTGGTMEGFARASKQVAKVLRNV